MAVTVGLGRIEPFDGSKDGDWQEYVERLEHFFVANGIDDAEKKRAVFLSVMGAATYKTLRNLVSPDKPGDKTYGELVEKLSQHFRPAPSEIVERFKFHTRVRRPGESIATYVAELRSMSEFCKFGESLEVMLRDRIVCGVNDPAIQKRLLAEPKLTYAKAVEIAQGAETAAQSLRELRTKPEAGKSSHSPAEDVFTTTSSPPTQISRATCYRCGRRGHTIANCRVDKKIVCYNCGKEGHMQRACKSKSGQGRQKRSKGKFKSKPVGRVQVDGSEEGESESGSDTLCHLRSNQSARVPPIRVEVKLDDCLTTMEVDTGASLSLMSHATVQRLWPGRSLEPTDVRLLSYSKEPIPVLGCTYVNLDYLGQTGRFPLVIVEGSGPSLLGRNWLSQIQLDWHQIHQVHSASLQAVLARYPSVFEEGLGTLRGFKARIYVDPNAQPRFYPARSVPYALRDLVDKELTRLEQEGTIEPVQISEWAAPIVPVVKKDKKSVRICGDFRITVNPVSSLDRYPLPKVEDLFARMKHGRYFSKLDLSQAYQQLPLDDDSRKYVVINTHKGLFRYTRLPFGIASAPGIFQRVIEGVLQGIDGAIVYLDDILISGTTEEQHLETLDTVLNRLNGAGLRVKKSKCEFMKPSVSYLGHQIDAQGLHPRQGKVRAIREAPTPTSVGMLKSHIGMLSYYSRFMPNLSTLLHPLYKLLRKGSQWHWGKAQQEAFNQSKELLVSQDCLTHFDPSLELTLACDASAYGLGAVLSHKMPDGSERPIGYASRTLNAAERNYPQLEKEGLSCIFGIKRFHDYLFGCHFELVTDHKPLLGLLKENRATSPQASARIKRWSLFLSSYEYNLVFRNTTAHANADALSRLPLPEEPVVKAQEPELVLLAEHLSESPVTSRDIREWTRRDPKLSRVLNRVQRGWPNDGDPDLEPYSSRRLELSSYEGCLMWGNRIVVPKPGREAVLRELHEGHPGMSKMKGLARMYVWWPKMEADVEKSVRLCQECQQVQPSPPAAPLNPWRWPSRPWSRLHLDFAGPFQGKYILITIDAHSKWIEAVCTASTSSLSVIEELRTSFAKFGIPESIVTDNGTCFVSAEFKAFLEANGIKHTTSAPYSPASNGLAERAVQTVKQGLKKVKAGSFNTRLAKVLFTYRLTPQATTGISPAELLLGRPLRTRLDLLRPNTAERVERKQQTQKSTHDVRSRHREFREGQPVFVKNFGVGVKWLPGIVSEKSGVSYKVCLEDGRFKHCHQNHLRSRVVEKNLSEIAADDTRPTEADIPMTQSSPATSIEAPTVPNEQSTTSEPTESNDATELNERRYPLRTRRPREHYEPGD